MRGKVTFRDGLHSSQIGEFVKPVAIGQGEWREIESAIGGLDAEARSNIADYCALLRSIFAENAILAADVRVTLDHIANERSDDKVLKAFDNCDERSKSMLDAALYLLDGPGFFSDLPTVPPRHRAAKLRAAALTALRGFQPKRGPSFQGWQRLSAEYAIKLSKWRDLPTTAHAFSDDPEETGAVVRLLLTILGIVNPNDSPESVSWCVKLLGEINAHHL